MRARPARWAWGANAAGCATRPAAFPRCARSRFKHKPPTCRRRSTTTSSLATASTSSRAGLADASQPPVASAFPSWGARAIATCGVSPGTKLSPSRSGRCGPALPRAPSSTARGGAATRPASSCSVSHAPGERTTSTIARFIATRPRASPCSSRSVRPPRRSASTTSFTRTSPSSWARILPRTIPGFSPTWSSFAGAVAGSS